MESSTKEKGAARTHRPHPSQKQEANTLESHYARSQKPFIPSWLDDAGLSKSEFRLYCHLCRRANINTGIAWPQAESIAAVCHMAKNTVWRTIRALEEKRLIRRVGKPFGGSSRYLILAQPIGAKEIPIDDPTGAKQAPIETPPISAKEILQSAQNDSHQSAQNDSREGNPIKVTKRRKSNREISQDGIQFAEWFRTLLPDGINLATNWKSSFAQSYDKLVSQNRTPEHIRKVCQWARNDSFWQTNFFSPAKLLKRNTDGITYHDVFIQKMRQSTGSPTKQTATVNTGNRNSNITEL